MDGIHLPDIGKVGLHVATDMHIRRKVAPWNMAESNRLKNYSKRLESERHERKRDLNRQEDRMRRKCKVLEKNRRVLHSERTQKLNKNKRGGKELTKSVKLPPIVLDKCMSVKRKAKPKKEKPPPKEIYTLNFRYSISVEHEDGVSLLQSRIGNMQDTNQDDDHEHDAASVASQAKSGRDSLYSAGRSSPQALSITEFVNSSSSTKRNSLVPPSSRILPPISPKPGVITDAKTHEKTAKDNQNLQSDFKMLSVKNWVQKHS